MTHICVTDSSLPFGLDPRTVELVKKFSVVLWSSVLLYLGKSCFGIIVISNVAVIDSCNRQL